MAYPNGNYLRLSNSEKQNSVAINDYLIYSSATFYCGVYNVAQTNIVGVIEYVVKTTESEEDVTISYVGEDTFRYDANGDIAIDNFETEKTL
ncbi:MAG: hypothetical protein NC548_25670 [Lachnospiraceae bacterium]|nr:hypothetical protein [Lachnospiraceae bacterium]